jgi:transglutaminase-like putative cysteine protease
MKRILLSLITLSIFSSSIIAQSGLPEFGVYSSVELNMKECAFDKDADAVVLLDEAFSNYDDEWHLITARRIRIKILNERGIDRGNIVIRFYSKDNFEYIRDIEGLTYSEQQGTSRLDRKSIYTEKVNDKFSNIKFALPNVKAGSIIEYKYESVLEHYGGLDRWLFQSDIPTIKSCYLLQVIPNHEFSYVVTKKDDLKISIIPKPDVGQIYFEMSNIPGLRFEPYMDAIKDYFQQVEFQLSGFLNVFGSKNNVNNTWKDIAYDLSTDKYLGGAVKKDLPKIDEVKALIATETSTFGKLNAIYNYVKNNFTWNGYDSKYAIDGLKKAWEKRSGTSGEINLLLISLLQSFDIEAFPLLVAERDYGKIDPKIPFIDRFNKTVAYATIDGKAFILDATQKYCPAGLTPFSLLNTYALVISKKTNNVITIASDNASYRSAVTIEAKLDKDGLLSGKAAILTNEYAKQSPSEKIKENEKDFIQKNIEGENPGISVDSFTYKNLAIDTEPLLQHVKFKEQVDATGAFALLNYNLFTGLTKNPFTKDERFTNVNFGYPYLVSVDETIELPPNCKVEGQPPNKKLVTPEKDISIAREITEAETLFMSKSILPKGSP